MFADLGIFCKIVLDNFFEEFVGQQESMSDIHALETSVSVKSRLNFGFGVFLVRIFL